VKGRFNNTRLGNIGRKGRKVEAPAMLNMVPKLALAAIPRALFHRIDKVSPAIIPALSTHYILVQQNNIRAGSRVNIHGGINEMLHYIGRGMQCRGIILCHHQ